MLLQTRFEMATFFKILFVIVLLLSMVLVLVLIGYMANPKESPSKESRDRLRHDVATRERVITPDSIFHQFFARPVARRRDKRK